MRWSRLLALVLLVVLQGCATSQLNLPPITDKPTGTHIVGKIIWHDLITHTPEASKRFYAALFGWEFEDLGVDFGFGRTVNYSLIRHQGELIGGMVDANLLGRPHPERLSQWVVVMSVADIDAAVASVKEAGGKILTPPTDVADRGVIAVIEDNQGARLALLRTRNGDPVQRSTPLGDFLWDEVWPDDVGRAVAFYQRLTGLQAGTYVAPSGREYRYMGTPASPRFGLLQRPIEWIAPTWASYLRVADVASITSRVPALGGTVLVGEQERLGEQVALIAGPSGAGIAVQTWSGRNVAESQQR